MKPSKASFCGCGLGSPQLGHWLSERHLESTFTESIHGWYRVSPVDGEFLSRHICCLAQCWACWHAYESPGGVLKRRFSLSRPGIQAYAFLTNLQAFGVWFTFQAARPHFFCLIRKLFKKKKNLPRSLITDKSGILVVSTRKFWFVTTLQVSQFKRPVRLFWWMQNLKSWVS